MRADRLLSIVLLLQVHQRLTTHELARRLEVSERTIHRDMLALSFIGVPVIAMRGSKGGWQLLEHYQTNLTGLTLREVEALFVSSPSRLLQDLGLSSAAEVALLKLLAALPSGQRRSAEFVQQRIYIDIAGWHDSEEAVPHLPILYAALWEERQIVFRYQRGQTTIERIASPLGLVARGSVWYLVAAVDDQIRTYRVARIKAVSILDAPAWRPAAFDLPTFWRTSWRAFQDSLPPPLVTTVRIDASALSRLQRAGRFIELTCSEAAEASGYLTVQLSFSLAEEALGYLLSFGDALEILDPPELRSQVTDLACRVLMRYTAERAPLAGEPGR